jgi:crooked neck
MRSDAGWEEYFDYVFPDEQAAQPQLRLLDAARKWKEAQQRAVCVIVGG